MLGGAAVAFQVQINGGLGKRTGVLEASFISFGIGTLALFFIVLFFGKGNFMAVSTVPKWQLFGGLLGAFYVIVFNINRTKARRCTNAYCRHCRADHIGSDYRSFWTIWW